MTTVTLCVRFSGTNVINLGNLQTKWPATSAEKLGMASFVQCKTGLGQHSLQGSLCRTSKGAATWRLLGGVDT
jgi:hypothetical protein